MLWDDLFEDVIWLWCRWCDQTGKVIPTGVEDWAVWQQQANAAEQQVNAEKE